MTKEEEMISRRMLVLPLIVLLVSGCATARVAKYPSHYFPTAASDVQVYRNFPPAPFEVIGEVEGDGDNYATWDMVYGKMREQAAVIGADGVVVTEQCTPEINAGSGIYGKLARGVVIKFR